MPPLEEVRPVRTANAGGVGSVGEMTLILVPQARAHSRRSRAVVTEVTGSPLQWVDMTGVACAPVGRNNVPPPVTARKANITLVLRCIIFWSSGSRTWHIRDAHDCSLEDTPIECNFAHRT